MVKSSPTRDDKFDLNDSHQLLTGAQAIVRLVMMQQARDKQAGLNTGGYVSGYRGSPIAGLEGAMLRARNVTTAARNGSNASSRAVRPYSPGPTRRTNTITSAMIAAPSAMPNTIALFGACVTTGATKPSQSVVATSARSLVEPFRW